MLRCGCCDGCGGGSDGCDADGAALLGASGACPGNSSIWLHTALRPSPAKPIPPCTCAINADWCAWISAVSSTPSALSSAPVNAATGMEIATNTCLSDRLTVAWPVSTTWALSVKGAMHSAHCTQRQRLRQKRPVKQVFIEKSEAFTRKERSGGAQEGRGLFSLLCPPALQHAPARRAMVSRMPHLPHPQPASRFP